MSIELKMRGRVATLTIDRPEVRNAMDQAAWLQLRDRVREVADQRASCLVVTAAGSEAFVAGSDVRGLNSRTAVSTLDGVSQQVLAELADLEFPTIAAINGHALGGGCELALSCDVRFATPVGLMGLPEVRLGLIPGAGGTWRLAEIVGIAKAKEMILAGLRVDMREAFRIGLVNRVIEQDALMAETYAYAEQIERCAPLAVRAAKLLLNAQSVDRPAAVSERLAQAFLFSTEHRVEGTEAFLERRRADFHGR